MTTLEQLVAYRDALLHTISNLEMGLHAEKKKADEYEFFRNDKNFDRAAMDAQVIRSQGNVKAIGLVLKEEKDKLSIVEQEITDANKLLSAHGTHPCLLNIIPHQWNVLSRHPSGKFSHRRCYICNTDEKVGYL